MFPPKATDPEKAGIFVRSLPRKAGESDYTALRRSVFQANAVMACITLVMGLGLSAGWLSFLPFGLELVLFFGAFASMSFSLHRWIGLFSMFEPESKNLPVPKDENFATRMKILMSREMG